MLKFFIDIIIVLFIAVPLSAQKNIIQELVSDRPDESESSSTVPVGTIQLETGFVIEYDQTGSAEISNFTLNTSLLRIGLLENLEFRLEFNYMSNTVKISGLNNESTTTGFAPLSIGFKTRIAEEKNILPEIAFIGFLKLPGIGGKSFRTNYTVPGFKFAFTHNLSEELSIGYNIGAEWNEDAPNATGVYALVVGYDFLEKTGIFAELYGNATEDGFPQHLIDGGITYLLFNNFQIDFSAGAALNDLAPDSFVAAGFTLRLPE